MKKEFNNTKPIEVEFHDVAETADYQDVNINKVVKSKKIPFKMVVAFLQKKAKSVLKSKAKVTELVTKALSFCKKLGNISFLKKWFLDIPKLCDMIIDTINGTYKSIPYSSLVMVVIAIIYTVSPVDILCDTIPILGVLDDAAILKIVLDTIKNDLESYTSWKEMQEVA